MKKNLKILLVDDSATALKFLENLLNKNDFSNIRSFSNAKDALNILEAEKFDIIITDIVMPEIDGYEFAAQIKKKNDIPIIIISSFYSKEDIEKTVRAYEVGAIAIIEKPFGNSDKSTLLSKKLIEIISKLYEEKINPPPEPPIHIAPKNQQYKIIAIGVSLGGPSTLSVLLKNIPTNFPVPIIIVQHISENFDQVLVKWLNMHSTNEVILAQDHTTPLAGKVYLAPASHHLTIDTHKKICLKDSNAILGVKPCIDIFFSSLIDTYGKETIAVLLTGMGDDGVKSLLKLKEIGAYTIAQHKDGCVMYGMPKAAIEAKAAVSIIPLKDLAKTLTSLVK